MAGAGIVPFWAITGSAACFRGMTGFVCTCGFADELEGTDALNGDLAVGCTYMVVNPRGASDGLMLHSLRWCLVWQ